MQKRAGDVGFAGIIFGKDSEITCCPPRHLPVGCCTHHSLCDWSLDKARMRVREQYRRSIVNYDYYYYNCAVLLLHMFQQSNWKYCPSIRDGAGRGGVEFGTFALWGTEEKHLNNLTPEEGTRVGTQDSPKRDSTRLASRDRNPGQAQSNQIP